MLHLLFLYLSAPCSQLKVPLRDCWGHLLEPKDQKAVTIGAQVRALKANQSLKQRMIKMHKKDFLLGPVDLNDFVASNIPAIPSRFLYNQSSNTVLSPYFE